MTGQILVT